MRSEACVVAFVCCSSGMVAQEWRQLLPERRTGHVLVHDEARGQSILFGGNGWRGLGLDDTWVFDGRWRQLVTPQSPTQRFWCGAAFDLGRSRMVLFGGWGGNGDTWEFDGTTWSQVITASSPRARQEVGMAYDATRARTVLFGGRDAANNLVAETWEYDGLSWTQINTSLAPPVQAGAPLAFDRARSRTVYFTGASTWEYDGLGWSVTSAVAPGARQGHAMAYDTARHRVVMVGGTVSATWEYDGTNWIAVPSAPSPPLSSPAVAYDPARARMLLFGEGDPTWEYDGANWTQVPDTRSPSARAGHALAYDSRRNRAVMFGGVTDPRCQYGWLASLDETWEFDTGWHRVTTPVAPAPRQGAALAFDSARGRMVLFGGFANTTPYPTSTLFADTWEYDGSNWTQVVTAASPPAGRGRLAYDPLRSRTVFFGGAAQTWEYDGANWTLVTPPLSPPARSQAGLVWSSARARIVMHGGTAANGQGMTDMWEYDGATWTQVNVSRPVQPYSSDVDCFYDSLRGRVVDVIAWPISPLTDVWECDGSGWTRVSSSSLPRARSWFATAWDQVQGRALLFGGHLCDVGSYDHSFPDTWEYLPAQTPTFAPFGTGCAGSAGVPVLAAVGSSLPALGTTFRLQVGPLPSASGAVVLAFGFDLAQWQGVPLPLELSSLGLPGCRLWLAPAGGALFVLHAGGSAVIALPIAASPALRGIVLATQGLVLDSAVPAGAAVTNAGVLRLF